MLHRAASNAYSWWWASHIRTKQSKWLDQSLQDMEHKVANVLKLIEEDGDSFAKRAEMYYKKRPELINFVEESYRAYRALAERYDHISTELQNANNTIASCFPEQVPFMEEDDDDDASPRPPRKMPEGFKQNIPKVPKAPQKELKSVTTTATRKFNTKKTAAASVHTPDDPKSGLSKEELRVEIDKIQKQILTLQTVKEFVKSSYDNAIAKYWETEEQIKELQERVSILQDELGEGIVIEDDEARRLMAEAALKSCQETLAQLQQKQEKSVDETRISNKRIKETREKLEALMNKFNYDQSNQKEPRAKRTLKGVEEKKGADDDGVDRMSQQRQELQLLQEKIKQHFDAGSHSSMSVSEMAEKIDELVNIVVSLETAVSSQTALVKRLRTETDELQSQIRTLEDDKLSLINDKTDLNNKLREMEEKMHGVQDLNHMVEDQNTNLLTHFTEAQCNLDHLSKTVPYVKADEDIEVKDLSQTKEKSSGEAKSEYGIEALNKDNGFELVNNGKSDKEPKVTSLVEGDVELDKEIKVSGLAENDMKSDKKPKVTSTTDNEVKSDMEITSMTDNEAKSDREIKVSGLEQNDVKSEREPKVTSLTENDVKSDKDLKVTASLETEEASTAENKQSTELKQENALNRGKIDEISRDSLSGNAGNQEVSQPGANKQEDKVHSQKKEANQEDEPDWRQLFMDGMKDREKALLTEYTNTLRSYKDVKKQLTEVEMKNQNSLSDTSLLLEELRASNALKDEEIKLLRQKLSLLQKSLQGNEGLAELRVSVLPAQNQDIEAMLKTAQPETSAMEERFRANIDEILEENLDFWLKFSTTFTEIQKFETTIKDLQTDVLNLEEKRKSSEGSSSIKYNVKSDARPIYKHLSEIQTELTVWQEKSILLKEDLKRRFSSLCNVQEEITKALRDSAEDDEFKFTSYQAAKFQGEVLNMKRENNKVADELQAGLDLVTSLQLEVEKALAKLNEQFGLSSSKRQEGGQPGHPEPRNRVPLRSFIFGVKPKKQHRSIFSCMTPGMHRKHRGSRGQSYI